MTVVPGGPKAQLRYFYITYNVQSDAGWTCEASIFSCEDHFALTDIHHQLYKKHSKAVRIEHWIEVLGEEAFAWLALQLKLDAELNPNAKARHLTLIKSVTAIRKPKPPEDKI